MVFLPRDQSAQPRQTSLTQLQSESATDAVAIVLVGDNYMEEVRHAARIGCMASALSAPRSMRPSEGRCLQLLGCTVAFVGFGTPISAEDGSWLLLRLAHKTVWLAAVALPMWSAGRSTDLTRAMVIGIVVDVLGIPWSYVLLSYVNEGGDRWRRQATTAAARS